MASTIVISRACGNALGVSACLEVGRRVGATYAVCLEGLVFGGAQPRECWGLRGHFDVVLRGVMDEIACGDGVFPTSPTVEALVARDRRLLGRDVLDEIASLPSQVQLMGISFSSSASTASGLICVPRSGGGSEPHRLHDGRWERERVRVRSFRGLTAVTPGCVTSRLEPGLAHCALVDAHRVEYLRVPYDGRQFVRLMEGTGCVGGEMLRVMRDSVGI